MAFIINRENEGWLERIRNYFQSIFEEEPPSLLETWNDIRPTGTDHSTTDEEPEIQFRRPSPIPKKKKNVKLNVKRNERSGFYFLFLITTAVVTIAVCFKTSSQNPIHMMWSVLADWWMGLNLLNKNRDDYFVDSLTGQHWSSFLKMYIGNYGFGIIQKDPTAWSIWSEFGACSVSCGDGIMTRTRECINGSPGDPGCHEGETAEQQSCKIAKCMLWTGWLDYLSFYPYITYPVSLFMIIYLLILVKKMKEDFSSKQRRTKKQDQLTSIHDHGENTSW